MEFFREVQSVNSGTLQVGRQRLHFSPHVRQMGVTDSRRYQPAALHSNLKAAENFGGVADGIVSTVQTVEPARMILLVKAFRPHEQMQVSECALNFDDIVVRWACWNSGDCIRKQTQRRTRRGIRVQLWRRCLALCFMDRKCGPKDQRTLQFLLTGSLTPHRAARAPLPSCDDLASGQVVPTYKASTLPA